MTDRVPPLTYVVGLLPSCVALVLWLALGSRLFLTPAPLFLAAVLFAAWYGGRGTGVAAALIGAACAALFPYPPGLSLSVPGPRGLVVELAILGLGGAVAEIVHLARQAEARARELEGLRLRAMHDDLTGL